MITTDLHYQAAKHSVFVQLKSVQCLYHFGGHQKPYTLWPRRLVH